MKKKVLTVLFTAVLAASVAACGNKETSSSSGSEASAGSSSASSTSATSASSGSEVDEEAIYESLYDPVLDLPLLEGEVKLADCLTLGEYKDLGISRESAEVNDEQVETELEAQLEPVVVEDPEAVVEQGDTIHLSYEGTIDGVAFDGGTSDDAELVIGSGSFIEGFEDGMVGMKVDEEKDLPLTFPEEYHSEDLAGKDCNFHVKVLSIARKPEATDAWVEEHTGGEYKTLDEYREHLREELLKEAQDNLDYQTKGEMWTKVIENSTFAALPSEYVESREKEYREYHESAAESYGMSMEEYLKNSGMSQYQFDLTAQLAAREYARDRILTEAIAEAEGLTEDSEEYKKSLDTLLEYYAMTEEELYEQFGEETVVYSNWNNAVRERLISFAS